MAVATSGRPTGLPAAAGRILWFALTRLAANSANLLTIARLLAIGPILLALLADDAALAFWIFLAAAVSDAADGFIAKRLTGVSPLGTVLDPVADKLLLASLLVALAGHGTLPWWLVSLCLVRDALLVVGTLALRSANPGFEVAPSPLGKLCTLVQLLLVGAGLAAMQVAPGLAPAVPLLIWATAATVVASGAGYFGCWWRGMSPGAA